MNLAQNVYLDELQDMFETETLGVKKLGHWAKSAENFNIIMVTFFKQSS